MPIFFFNTITTITISPTSTPMSALYQQKMGYWSELKVIPEPTAWESSKQLSKVGV